MSLVIEARGVSRQFKVGSGVVHALKGISLDVKKGELTILRGRSGSGKTTLINILGALDMPSGGEVFFHSQKNGKAENHDIVELSAEKRDRLRRVNMAFVFQSVALISTMTALENVELALRLAKYPINKRKARAKHCLEIVGLADRMTHFPNQLSGGEQQRVAIARAISHEPEIILADEPTAELDSTSAKIVVNMFKNLVLEHDIAVLMTTHDVEMMTVADKIYTLSDGELISVE